VHFFVSGTTATKGGQALQKDSKQNSERSGGDAYRSRLPSWRPGFESHTDRTIW